MEVEDGAEERVETEEQLMADASNDQEEALRSLETLLLMVAIANKEGGNRKEEADEFIKKSVPDWDKINGKALFENRKFVCANCEKSSSSAMKRCASCTLLHYCSQDCQKKHWSTHKIQCQDYAASLKDVPVFDIMPVFYRWFMTGLISIPEFLYLQSEHMLTVADKIKNSCGPGSAKAGLSVSWMESSIEFEGNFTHPVFLLNWVDSNLNPLPETFFRVWLMAEKSDKEKDILGRELVFQVVKILEGFGVEIIAVTTGGGFERQGTFPLAEVALVRSELVEEIATESKEDQMDTS